MNTNELHLKKNWDDKIEATDRVECFKDVYRNDYENIVSWLRIYFNNLEFEDKCQIICYAGWDVITKLKGIVENHELISFSLYSWILTHDINHIYCEFSSKNNDIMYEMNKDKTLNDDRFASLNYNIECLHDENAQLRAENVQLRAEIEQLKKAR